MTEKHSEEKQIAAAQKGDKKAISQLVNKYSPRIYAIAFRLMQNEEDAEDVLQETIATMWRSFDRYESGTDFQAWAVTIAKYTILNFRKKQKRMRFQFKDDVIKALEGKSDQFIVKLDDRLIALKTCVKKLPDEDVKLMKMRYDQELSVITIAGRFDMSARMIYKWLSRTHNILLRCIRRTLAEEAAI